MKFLSRVKTTLPVFVIAVTIYLKREIDAFALALLFIGLMGLSSKRIEKFISFGLDPIYRIIQLLIQYVSSMLVFALVLTPIAFLKKISQKKVEKSSTFNWEKDQYYNREQFNHPY